MTDRRHIVPVPRRVLILWIAALFAAVVMGLLAVARGQEPITYTPVIQPGYYYQPTPVWVPPRPVYTWVARPRYTYLGQAILGPRWELSPVVQPVQPQAQPATP